MRVVFLLVLVGCGVPTKGASDSAVTSSDTTTTDSQSVDSQSVDSHAADSVTDTSDGGSDSGTGDTASAADLDGDGLLDVDEQRIAAAYLPFISLPPDDGCPTMGVLFRATPHPLDPTKLHIVYDLLYDNDCGVGGHVGDDEVFAVTVDPAVAAPGGILAIVAIAHQNTLCEKDSMCGCGGGALTACSLTVWDGGDWPEVFPSIGKHGNYLYDSDCEGACLFTNYCALATTPPSPILVNAGEPDHPLTRDLTTSGLVTAENGWTNAELFDYDPWGDSNFGGAGNVTSDLTDTAFDTPVPVCP